MANKTKQNLFLEFTANPNSKKPVVLWDTFFNNICRTKISNARKLLN